MASKSVVLCKSTRAAASASSRCSPFNKCSDDQINNLPDRSKSKSIPFSQAPHRISKFLRRATNQSNLCMLSGCEQDSRLDAAFKRTFGSAILCPKSRSFRSFGALRGDCESLSLNAFVSGLDFRSVSTRGVTFGAPAASLQYNERVASTPGAKYFATDKRPIVLFDGVCNFCNGGVNFMLVNDPEGKLRFAALQSEAGKALLQRAGRAPEDISSIVLVEPDRSYAYSEAILRIAQYLPGPFGVLGQMGLFAPGLVRDTFYKLVAENRYNIFGKKDECRLGDERFDDRFVKS